MLSDNPNERLKRMARNMEYGDEMHEIVRRLAEPGAVEIRVVVEQVARDAAKLWAKMQEDAKGGDGETSV
jgi:hypothetical protein